MVAHWFMCRSQSNQFYACPVYRSPRRNAPTGGVLQPQLPVAPSRAQYVITVDVPFAGDYDNRYVKSGVAMLLR